MSKDNNFFQKKSSGTASGGRKRQKGHRKRHRRRRFSSAASWARHRHGIGTASVRNGGGIGGGLWHICGGGSPSAPTRPPERGAGSSSCIELFGWKEEGVEGCFSGWEVGIKQSPQTVVMNSSRAERFRRILFYENTMMLDISR